MENKLNKDKIYFAYKTTISEISSGLSKIYLQWSAEGCISIDIVVSESEIERFVKRLATKHILTYHTQQKPEDLANELAHTRVYVVFPVGERAEQDEYRILTRGDIKLEDVIFTTDKPTGNNVMHDSASLHTFLEENVCNEVNNSITQEHRYSYEYSYVVRIHALFSHYGKDKFVATAKRALKSFPYYFRKGECIIPKEYLAKNAEGIVEHVNSMRKRRHTNRLEKQILKDSLRTQKQKLYVMLYNVGLRIFDSTYTRYTNSFITVQGIRNKTMMKKNIVRLLEGKSQTEILQLTDEEMLDMAKQYWSGELQKCVQAVGSASISELPTWERATWKKVY